MARHSMWRKAAVWAILVFLLWVGTRAAAEGGRVAGGDWLHFGYDDTYASNNPAELTIDATNVAQLERKWGIGCDDTYFSVVFRTPAIYDGVLYNSSAGSRLTAYNARTGAPMWQFGNGNLAWAPQPSVSADGLVLYLEEASPTYLYAVDGMTGGEVWTAPVGFELGFQGAAEAVVTADEAADRVYVLEEPYSGDGKLYALNMQTGAIEWYMSQATDGTEFVGNYPLLKDGKIYAAADRPIVPYPYHGEKMLRIDPATQAIEMEYDRPEPENYWGIESYTLCGDKLIAHLDYQYDPDKLVVAYDVYTPTIAWQAVFPQAITGKIACNPDKNRVYVPTDPYLYALDAATGDEVWKYLGLGEIHSPSIANGIVYFLSRTNMYAIDEDTKALLFQYPLGYEADETTQVAIADGMLYFSGNGGTCDLYALGLPDTGDGYRVFLPLAVRGE